MGRFDAYSASEAEKQRLAEFRRRQNATPSPRTPQTTTTAVTTTTTTTTVTTTPSVSTTTTPSRFAATPSTPSSVYFTPLTSPRTPFFTPPSKVRQRASSTTTTPRAPTSPSTPQTTTPVLITPTGAASTQRSTAAVGSESSTRAGKNLVVNNFSIYTLYLKEFTLA